MYGTATYSLVVTPVRTFSSWLSKTYLIGNDPDTNNGWAHNFVYIPVFLYVNEENAINPDWIEYLAAHELGHNILFAGRTNTVMAGIVVPHTKEHQQCGLKRHLQLPLCILDQVRKYM